MRGGLAGLAASLLMAACSSADKPKPVPLEPLTPKVLARQVWTAKLDSVQFPLAMAVNGGMLTVAGTNGGVLALDAGDGRTVWRSEVGAPVSAGVGSDGRFAAVVTRDNELVVLDQGREAWRSRLASRVTTEPLVAGERVFVVGVDRIVHAFDVLDGRKLWVLQRPSDALTLAQRGVLQPFKDTLLTGQGPRLAGIDPLKGTVRWEVAIASPRGTNEVERLADLVGPSARVGERVCARAFQAAVGCVDAQKGTLLWTRNAGGTEGVSSDAELVVGADASSRITAWKAASGDIAWTSERLLHRALSAPAIVGDAVVFGDFEGQVHFLERSTGELLARLPTDGSPITAAPVIVNGTVVVATRSGGLHAFRLPS
jgi:outer membrane assembly lipoprotein YfgL